MWACWWSGEKPYAEFEGDSVGLTAAQRDLDAFAAMKKANIPVVVIVLSAGR